MSNRLKSLVKGWIDEQAVDFALLLVFFTMLSMWFWGPILRRWKPQDERIVKAVFVAGVVATIGVIIAGTYLLSVAAHRIL